MAEDEGTVSIRLVEAAITGVAVIDDKGEQEPWIGMALDAADRPSAFCVCVRRPTGAALTELLTLAGAAVGPGRRRPFDAREGGGDSTLPGHCDEPCEHVVTQGGSIFLALPPGGYDRVRSDKVIAAVAGAMTKALGRGAANAIGRRELSVAARSADEATYGKGIRKKDHG